MGRVVIAFTLGNPERYERALDEAKAIGSPLMKGEGGVVFLSASEAEGNLEDGNLPPSWFADEEVRPGRVYEIELPFSIFRCTEIDGSGLRRLTQPAEISRVGESAMTATAEALLNCEPTAEDLRGLLSDAVGSLFALEALDPVDFVEVLAVAFAVQEGLDYWIVAASRPKKP